MATGIAEGAIASLVLDKLLETIKKYKDSKETLSRLQERLQRLHPLVKRLSFDGSANSEAARNWLNDLNRVLTNAWHLVLDSQGNIKRTLNATDLESIHSRISDLLIDSFAIQLLEQIEARGQLKELISNQGSRVREGRIKRVVGHLQRIQRNTGDGSSSSTVSNWNSRWDRVCAVPEPPAVTFGGDVVVEEQILDILHGEYNKWIIMWGMGGVGKTCTALKLYHSDLIQRHFTGGTYWVTVGKDNFDEAPLEQILKLVYEKITGESAPDFPNDLQAAKDTVKGLLNREKVLLVLDDVWATQILQALDVLSESRKGVLLTTTRDKGIFNFEAKDGERLKRIAESAKIVVIRPLSEEDSWRLFSYHAFEVYGKPVPNERTPLRSIAEAVAEECKGLPLALKVTGSTMDAYTYLSLEDKRMGGTVEKKWRKALEELRRASKEGVRRTLMERNRKGSHHEEEDASLYDRLQWSLESLVKHPPLENCFSYFAAYAEDSEIPVKDLLRMWAAEGLCRGGEEEGVELLGILIAKSMVELTDDGRTCKIHDVMRDLLNLNLQYDAEKMIPASKRTCLYEAGSIVSAFPNNWTNAGVLSAKRLSMRSTDLCQLPHQLYAPDLSVLMLSGTPLTSLPRKFFVTLSNLKVLDLAGTDIEKVPGSVLKSLRNLVVLDLRYCSFLKKVSNRLDGLEHLEILLLSGRNSLSGLPRMKGLIKLHTLSLGFTYSMTEHLLEKTMPGRPTRDMLRLPSLRRLNMRYNFQPPFYRRAQLPAIPFPSALERLKIAEFRNLPGNLTELQSLKVLKIEAIDVQTLPSLDKLPSLEELTINGFYDLAVEGFPESFGRQGAFPSLRRFKISYYSGSTRHMLWTFQAGTMPKIETLVLGSTFDTSRSIGFPASLGMLPTLKVLHLRQADDEADGLRALELLFSRPNCFPSLEHLMVSTNARLPALPSHLSERQKEGRLKIQA